MTSTPTIKPRVSLDCDYLCQYDNELYPEGSCNMTSLGMCLQTYKKAVPGPYKRISDNLLHYCDQNGLDRHSLTDIAKVSQHFGLGDNAGYGGTLEDVKLHLSSGYLVIVQGTFTASGHVIVIRGYDELTGEWECNDPAGRYPHYSNPGWLTGKQVYYPATWFDAHAAPCFM